MSQMYLLGTDKESIYMNQPIEHLDLPRRSYNSLKRIGIHTVEQVLQMGEEEFASKKNVGPKKVDEVFDRVTNFLGLSRGELIQFVQNGTQLGEILSSADSSSSAGQTEVHPEIVNFPVEVLDIPSRALGALKRANVHTIADLLLKRKSNYRTVRGLGEKLIASVEASLLSFIEQTKEIDEQQIKVHLEKLSSPNYSPASSEPLIDIGGLGDPINLVAIVSSLAKIIFTVKNQPRLLQVLSYRYGLEGSEVYTLQDIGDAYGITRERVRQLQEKALAQIHNLLSGKKQVENYVVPKPIVQEFNNVIELIQQKETVVTMPELLDIFESRYSTDSTNSDKEIRLLMAVIGYKIIGRPSGYSNDVHETWIITKSAATRQIWAALQASISALDESVHPLSMFEIQIKVNRKRKKKFKKEDLENSFRMSKEVEKVGTDFYQVKLENLPSLADQAYRILHQKNSPMHYRDIAREISHALALVSKPADVQARSLVSQLVADDRFAAIGSSGKWCLANWNSYSTATTVEIMKEFFHVKKSSATVKEIYEYVITKRPQVPKTSIHAYLYDKDEFVRVSRTEYELAAWGTKPYLVPKKQDWNTLLTPILQEMYYKSEKDALPLRQVALTFLEHLSAHKTSVSEGNIYAWLKKNPAISTFADPQNPQRKIAKFNPKIAYDSQSRKLTMNELVHEVVYEYLSKQNNKRSSVSDVAAFVMSQTGCHKQTFYAYLNNMNSVKKEKVGNILYCYIAESKAAKHLHFEQVDEIENVHLKNNISRALLLLNEQAVDVSLFQLGKIFENELKKFLTQARTSGVYAIKAKDVGRLYDMIECISDLGIVKNKHHLTFLRQERNERAHGNIPSAEEREQMMRHAPFLAELYLDYILLFYKEYEKLVKMSGDSN